MIHDTRPLGAWGRRGPALLNDDLWPCDLATGPLLKQQRSGVGNLWRGGFQMKPLMAVDWELATQEGQSLGPLSVKARVTSVLGAWHDSRKCPQEPAFSFAVLHTCGWLCWLVLLHMHWACGGVLQGSRECWVYTRTHGVGRNGMDLDLGGTRDSTKGHGYLVLWSMEMNGN